MIAVSLRGLSSRRFRSLLSALAIVLGVAMVSGTYVLTDSIGKAFDTIFTRSYESSDAIVTGREAFTSQDALPPSFPGSLLGRVRSLPGVAAAAGAVQDSAKLVDKDGKSIGGGGPPTLAFGIAADGTRFSPLTVKSGNWPRGPDEVAIDTGTARKKQFAVGDAIRASAKGPLRSFRVAGLVNFGGVSSIGGATIAVFDLPTAQRLFDKVARLDAIYVKAERGLAPAQLVATIREALPSTTQVRTGQAEGEKQASDVNQGIDILQKALLAFGGIALFVGAFIIFNSLSITVAQRAREFALLRTIGASRRQVLGSVVLEAFVIGLLASVSGLFLGLALAKGLNSVFTSFGIDLPQAGLVFATRTIVVSLLVGTLITLLASLVPAVRATRVPPIAVLREGAAVPRTRFSRFVPLLALLVSGLGVALLALGLFKGDLDVTPRLAYLGFGCFGIFIGIALLSPRLVRPLASVLGAPGARFDRAPGGLARENAMRNPGRTAVTAAALMIGVTLVTFVAVFAQGLKHSFEAAIDDQLRTSYVVSSDDAFTPFDPSSTQALERVPGVAVSEVRGVRGRAFGKTSSISGIDPTTIARNFHFDWLAGSDAVLATLGRDGALVTDKYAQDHELAVGSRFAVEPPSFGSVPLVVRGIFEPPAFLNLIGSISVPKETIDANWQGPKNLYTFVSADQPGPAVEAQLRRALAPWPDETVRTQSAYVDKSLQGLDQTLNILYVLLALSVIVSLFGIVNTLVLSVFERTRELGMLRAIGTTRWQVRRMIGHESVITALIGAVLGLLLGVGLAALVTLSLKDEGLVFAVPWGSLVAFAVVAGLCGVLAAILPARRASRLNVLEALQYE